MRGVILILVFAVGFVFAPTLSSSPVLAQEEVIRVYSEPADLISVYVNGYGTYQQIHDEQNGADMLPGAVVVANTWWDTGWGTGTYDISRGFLFFNATSASRPGHDIVSTKLYLKRWSSAYYDASDKVKVQWWTDGFDGVSYDDYRMFSGENIDDDQAFMSQWSSPGMWNYLNLGTGWGGSYWFLCFRHDKDVSATVPTEPHEMTFGSADNLFAYLEFTVVPEQPPPPPPPPPGVPEFPMALAFELSLLPVILYVSLKRRKRTPK